MNRTPSPRSRGTRRPSLRTLPRPAGPSGPKARFGAVRTRPPPAEPPGPRRKRAGSGAAKGDSPPVRAPGPPGRSRGPARRRAPARARRHGRAADDGWAEAHRPSPREEKGACLVQEGGTPKGPSRAPQGRKERDAWPRRRPGAWTPRDGAGSPPLTGPVAWGWRTSVRPYVRVARPAFETPRPGRGRRPGRRPGDSNPPDDASSRAPWGHAAASGRRRSSQGEV